MSIYSSPSSDDSRFPPRLHELPDEFFSYSGNDRRHAGVLDCGRIAARILADADHLDWGNVHDTLTLLSRTPLPGATLSAILNTADAQGNTLLHLLAKLDGPPSLTSEALELGADPLMTCTFKHVALPRNGRATPLQLALLCGNAEMASILVPVTMPKSGMWPGCEAPLILPFKYGPSPKTAVDRLALGRLVPVMVRYAADPFAHDREGKIALDYAISSKEWGSVRRLIQTGLKQKPSPAAWRRTADQCLDDALKCVLSDGPADCVKALVQLASRLSKSAPANEARLPRQWAQALERSLDQLETGNRADNVESQLTGLLRLLQAGKKHGAFSPGQLSQLLAGGHDTDEPLPLQRYLMSADANPQQLRRLLELGADPLRTSSIGDSFDSLFSSVHAEDQKMIQALVDSSRLRDADEDICTDILVRSLRHGTVNSCLLLLAAGVPLPPVFSSKEYTTEHEQNVLSLGFVETLQFLSLRRAELEEQSIRADFEGGTNCKLHLELDAIIRHRCSLNDGLKYARAVANVTEYTPGQSQGWGLESFLPDLLFSFPQGAVSHLALVMERQMDFYQELWGWHPNEAEFLALLNHPSGKNSGQIVSYLTTALTSITRFVEIDDREDANLTHEVVQAWGDIGFFTHDFLRDKFFAQRNKVHSETGRRITGESLYVRAGGVRFEAAEPTAWGGFGEGFCFSGMSCSKPFLRYNVQPHLYGEQREVYLSPDTAVYLWQGLAITSHPAHGTLVIRNSSPERGRHLLLHPSYFSSDHHRGTLTHEDLCRLTPANFNDYFEFHILDRLLYEDQGDISHDLTALTDQYYAFRHSMYDWYCCTDTVRQSREVHTPEGTIRRLTGAHQSPGFSVFIQFLRERYENGQEELRRTGKIHPANELPDLALAPRHAPAWVFGRFPAAEGGLSQRLKLTSETLQAFERLADFSASEEELQQSGVRAFMQTAIQTGAHIIPVSPVMK